MIIVEVLRAELQKFCQQISENSIVVDYLMHGNLAYIVPWKVFIISAYQ